MDGMWSKQCGASALLKALCKVQQDALARSVTLECMVELIAKATFNLAATQPLTADNYCRCGTLLAVLIETILSIN
jgi:hypothetical protein